MVNKRRFAKPVWIVLALLMAFGFLSAIMSGFGNSSIDVSAHPVETFGPACGAALIDGEVDALEWSAAYTQTFLMIVSGQATPFTATLHVMNSANNLYLGITINDDELSTSGEFLPEGDGFRIDFDNDNSGTLFALLDDVLSDSAGVPQFEDNFIQTADLSSALEDTLDGGTLDGFGVASRIGELNHFEMRHPLCSGDAHDFCLVPSDVVGFRLEYLDAQANGDFGGSQFFPGYEVTSIADIIIGNCITPDYVSIHLPIIQR